MMSSYNRQHPKPRSAQLSKKNSMIGSTLYKEVNEALKDYR
jgi:hypothetical protein